ncbi:MAG: hypothetical protein KME60_24160 [Cyanomargarita calcarea GSE-NOS-MK-12-04C]|jgi:hypothetical protein|uniref:Uncharacterized protein n=1 Tax=Cyanomargarita calcarea GSE-NOS-MK-12-04C TaxID=2839659 RepID=A0A951UU75_9CYAN|nr:hypothetical protein [Cyanomargarita calcarea GSE-NOS-MK-12-04C]
MIFFICNDEIAGITDSCLEAGLPSGYKCIEGPNLLVHEVYWDGENVLPRPEQPSNEHYWDSTTNAWEATKPAVVPLINLEENWDKLISLLQSSPEWAHAYTAAERTLKANTAFTTLLSSLTTLRKVETLQFALAKLREAMSSISGLGDFSAEEIASINQKLTDSGFDFQLTGSTLPTPTLSPQRTEQPLHS